MLLEFLSLWTNINILLSIVLEPALYNLLLPQSAPPNLEA